VNWTEGFAADLRSLAVLRIVVALTVLVDLIDRAPYLRTHYSDDGILPRGILIDQLNKWWFSLSLMNGTTFFQGLIFAVTAVAAVALLVGYQTRLMTFVVWLLMLSIHARNLYVISGGDILLRLLLFWSMFLPLGAYWSVDRLRSAPQPGSKRILSLATAGLFLQIAFMYWFTVLLKSGPAWRVDGTALHYAFNIEEITTPLGAYLLQYPALLKVLTFGTLALEVGAILLLFCPVFTGPVRTAAVVAVMAFHMGIWLTMSIGNYPWVSASCMVCFLPSWFWDTLVPRISAALPKFSPVAGCARYRAARLAHDFQATFWPRMVALGSAGQFSNAARSGAIAGGRMERMISSPVIPRGERLSTLMHDEVKAKWSSPLLNLVAGFFLIYIFVWNLTGVSTITMTENARALGISLGLSQYWSMFAPTPTYGTSWYVLPGVLQDGRQVDLFPYVLHGDPHAIKEVTWEKPQDIRNYFTSERWRKYFDALSQEANTTLLLPFGQSICRSWNDINGGTPSQLETFQIVYNWQLTLEDNRKAPPEPTVISNHIC
jgi:hypothetical protein